MTKRIAILGSTGSIGTSTLAVVKHLPGEFTVAALAARSNIELLERQVREFSPELVAVYEERGALELQRRIPHVRVLAGMEGLKAVAEYSGADFVMLAMAGSAGLEPAVAAIRAGKQIGLANKEIMIAGGELVSQLAREKGVDILPVDSEHSALFQCLKGEKREQVRRLILTASGGPFRKKSYEELERVTVAEALKHPNWTMGARVTIDSSTLMNKGLEMIEARWLFGIEKIEVVVHPQSLIHSMVEYVDGSIIAQISKPDMVLPIQYAMTYPERKQGMLPPFDFRQFSEMTFEEPDKKKFVCLQLAIDALAEGRSYPCFLNAAGEVLVERFLTGQISWIEIGRKLDKLMSSHRAADVLTLDSILSVDRLAREIAKKA
ncbi:MAG: 1-deoxy-D-xylulose-5-phosphate reductoisomerase [Verrucomicrobia bacterium]|nr:1-deoxy-D-xylulose-5-phosphate reductoisomerase [Verrucomicrobiota bacterium]